MAQSAANVNVALNLDSASFQTSAEKARRVMADTLTAIRSESVRTGEALGGITKATQGFATANDNVKRFGNIAQQAGFQVGDFAVQIAGGTSGLTAFIQQGSQIAGAFGPVGAVIGAVGAVVGVFAKTLLDTGTSAEDAATQLKKLTEGTGAYQQSLSDVEPLQKAFLQNLVESQKEAEAAAGWYERLVGFVGQLNTSLAEVKVSQQTGRGIDYREGIQNLIAGREREDKAIDLFLNRRKPEIISRAEFKPGLEARDYVQAEEAAAKAAAAAVAATVAAAKTANDKRIADAKRTKDELIQLEKERSDYDAESIRNEVELFEKGQKEKQDALRKQVESAAAAINKRNEAVTADAQRESERLAEVYTQPFKDLATNISSTLSSGIQDALSGDFDFATFAEGFGDIFADTLAASITAALTPALTSAAESFGDALTSALKSSTAAGGGPGGPAGPGLTTGGALLGGAAFGGIAGSLFGAYGPGMKPGNFAGIGGGIGGGLGGLAGFALTGGSPLGALAGAGIGGLLGSVTGGLFGGQNNLGNDRSAQAYRSGRGITYGDTSFSQENRDITQGILDQVQALQKALEAAGGAIADFGLRIEAGNKSGITVNGKKYRDAQAAMAASLEVLIGSTSALTVSQQTVLANTKAKDATGIVADLDVATQFDAITFQGTELTRQLVALDAEMAEFGKRAQALGLDINAVAAAHEKERQALLDAQAAEQNAIRAAIEGLAPSGNTLDIVLAQLNDQVQELAKAATDAGLPLDNLAAAHQRAAAQLVAANVQLQQSLALQVSALDPATDQLSLALAQLNQQVQELAAQITASGGSLDELAGAHQRAAADIVNQFQEQQRLQRQQAQDEQRRLAEQVKAQQAQARAEAAARQEQIRGFQAQVALLEAEPLEATVINIRENIRQLIEQGRALGLTAQGEREIRAAESRLVTKAIADEAAARAEQTRNFQQQTALLEASPLEAALIQIRERFNELIAQGKTLGLSSTNEAQLRAAQARAETAARERAKLDQDAFSLQLRAMGTASTDAGLQMAELQLSFKELTIRAIELGVPLSEVTAAQARATQALQDALVLRKAEIRDQLAAAVGNTGLNEQLRELSVQMGELAREAQAVGIPLAEVTAAHTKAAQRIRDEWAEMLADMQRRQRDATQGIIDAQRGAAGAIDQFLNPFKEALSSRGIGQGVYSGASLTQSGLKEFRDTLRQARTGDTGALSSLVGIGQGAIAQARQTYGSTKAFADIFREIEAGFREQQGVLEAKRDELLSQIGAFTRETVNEIIRLRVQAIGDLRADLAKLSRDIVVAVEGNA